MSPFRFYEGAQRPPSLVREISASTVDFPGTLSRQRVTLGAIGWDMDDRRFEVCANCPRRAEERLIYTTHRDVSDAISDWSQETDEIIRRLSRFVLF